MQDLHNLFLDLSYTIFFYLITILNFNNFFPISRMPSRLYNPYRPAGGFGAVIMWIPYLNLVIFLLM